jgi:hypothetical protein
MDMKTDSYGKTTTLGWVFDGSDPTVPNEVTIRWTPETPTEQLSGRPEALFNRPTAGGDLIARVPLPAVDRTTETTLQVHSSTGKGPVLVPIKIQRPA